MKQPTKKQHTNDSFNSSFFQSFCSIPNSFFLQNWMRSFLILSIWPTKIVVSHSPHTLPYAFGPILTRHKTESIPFSWDFMFDLQSKFHIPNMMCMCALLEKCSKIMDMEWLNKAIYFGIINRILCNESDSMDSIYSQ